MPDPAMVIALVRPGVRSEARDIIVAPAGFFSSGG